jgi:hypothetical protein
MTDHYIYTILTNKFIYDAILHFTMVVEYIKSKKVTYSLRDVDVLLLPAVKKNAPGARDASRAPCHCRCPPRFRRFRRFRHCRPRPLVVLVVDLTALVAVLVVVLVVRRGGGQCGES